MHNCCSLRDQMLVHKRWRAYDLNGLQFHYRSALDQLRKLKNVFTQVDLYDLAAVGRQFVARFSPPQAFVNHLEEVVTVYGERKSRYYIELLDDTTARIEKANVALTRYRQGLFCSLCDARNHDFVSFSDRQIVYKEQFCEELVRDNMPMLWAKYGEMFYLVSAMDEFTLLVANRTMLEPEDRAAFVRYRLILQKCKEGGGSAAACADVCREYNLNCYNRMFDGEAVAVKSFLEKYLDLWDKLFRPESAPGLLVFDKKRWTKRHLKRFRRAESVVAKQLVEAAPRLEKNSFHLQLKSSAKKAYKDYEHPTNSIQLESLDDALSSFQIYRMAEEPIDICQFSIEFSAKNGFDPQRDSQHLNFDIQVDQLLALLYSKSSDVLQLDEQIEQVTTDMINRISILDVANFVNNCFIEFADEVVRIPKKSGLKGNGASLVKMGLLVSLFALALW